MLSQSHGIVSTTSEDQQQQDWILDNLEAIEQQLSNLNVVSAESAQDTNDDTDYPVERIDFDLKHGREHLSKLKFNLLELASKKRFLELIADEEEWRDALQQWAPGPLRMLESAMQSQKDTLKQTKQEQRDCDAGMESVCEGIAVRQRDILRKRDEAVKLVNRVKELKERLQLKEQDNTGSGDVYSLEELQGTLAALKVDHEKKQAALAVQRQANSSLTRLLQHQEGLLERQIANRDSLAERVSSHARLHNTTNGKHLNNTSVEELCKWQRAAIALVDQLTGVHVDVVRPDHLHVTVCNPQTAASVPIHLFIDVSTGKLSQVQIGSTTSTPHLQWKELIEQAVKMNDIPLLIRQVHYKLLRQQ